MRTSERPRSDPARTERSYGDEDAKPGSLEGAVLGRYVVGAQLGAGAMGVVYRAVDPKLGRRVAVKVLHPRGDGGGATRLLQEARAMARLSHPNVITVHDVGAVGGRVFLAMDEVDGDTLTAWLASTRTTAQILDTLIAAGRGLAGAHDGGVVHRDFKPDNVMVGRDGRVLVTDFGVASESAAVEPASGASLADAVDESSAAGDLVGTPAYMAPELFTGFAADARSDQFAFCVSLYEALYGHRPYRGATAGALFLAMANGEMREPAGTRKVSAWLHRAIVKGLSHAPTDRHDSMHALLGVLERGRRPARWAPWIGVVGVAAGVAFAVRGPASDDDLCAGSATHLEGIWDAKRAEAVGAALAQHGGAVATETVPRVRERLDRYAVQWVAMRTEVCAQAQLGPADGAAVTDLRNACLDRQLRAVDQVASVLEHADPVVARNAIAMVAGLTSLRACADIASLRSKLPAPREPAAVRRVRGELDRVRALTTAGRFEASLLLVEELAKTASTLDYAPLEAEVTLSKGRALAEAARHDEAIAVLNRAYFAALQVHHDEIAALSAAELAYVVGYRQARHDEGTQWGEHALAAALRVDDGGLAEAQAHHNLGVIADTVDDSASAQEHYERAYDLRRERLDPDHPDLGRSLNALGNVYFGRGEYDEALRKYRASLELRERVFGPSHPEVAGALNNVAIALMRNDEFVGAIAALRRAGEIYVSALGREHPDVAQATDNLGTALRRNGQPQAAADEHRQALEIRNVTQGAEHPDTGDSLVGLGRAYSELGRHAEAHAFHSRALEVYERGFGTGHPAVGSALLGLGIAEIGLGRLEDAAVHLERAAELFAPTPRATEVREIEALLRTIATPAE